MKDEDVTFETQVSPRDKAQGGENTLRLPPSCCPVHHAATTPAALCKGQVQSPDQNEHDARAPAACQVIVSGGGRKKAEAHSSTPLGVPEC